MNKSETELLNNDITITIESYELLLLKIKTLQINFTEGNEHITSQLLQILEDCNNCVIKGFNIISLLLEDSNLQEFSLCQYIEGVICILQLLLNIIKKLLPSITMNCCTLKTFPTDVGNILLTVFRHCKDSECLYSFHLKVVEKQLKELFRSCHELQLTYLLALDKHFNFDIDNEADQVILFETLNINIQICEVVQALDIKTMAEQWKGYTTICEKYSKCLTDATVINKSIELLTDTVINNVKITLQVDEEEKVILRSLKVAGFAIKILMKISNFLKLSNDNYKKIVELFFYVDTCSNTEKSPNIKDLVEVQIVVPAEAYLMQLVTENQFLDYIISIDVTRLERSDVLNFLQLMASVMKNYPYKQSEKGILKCKLINCIFSILPYCNFWFKEMEFKNMNKKIGCEFYEYLLLHTTAFTLMLNQEEYMDLEKLMYEAILGTNTPCALFSSNLWVLLCRKNPKLLMSTLVNLLRIYQKCESLQTFISSPQQIHLNYTIGKLFELMSYDDKVILYRQFNIQEDRNINVWCALKISSLPDNISVTAEKIVTERCLQSLNQLFKCETMSFSEFQVVIKSIKLLSTCSFREYNLYTLENVAAKACLKACPRHASVLRKSLDSNSLWYFRYLEALTLWTDCLVDKFKNRKESKSLSVMLHVISEILQIGNNETKILLFKLLCKLLQINIGVQNDTLLLNCMKTLFIDVTISEHLFSIAISDPNLNRHLSEIITKFEDVRNSYKIYCNRIVDEREIDVDMALDFKYTHKCIEDAKSELQKSHSNVELLDLEKVFAEIQEPVSKKAKISCIEIETLVGRLEKDVYDLTQVDITDSYKDRISSVCQKLNDLIS